MRGYLARRNLKIMHSTKFVSDRLNQVMAFCKPKTDKILEDLQVQLAYLARKKQRN